MLYYDIAYHINGGLVMRLTNADDYAGKELLVHAVYTEIAKHDAGRPTKSVTILIPTDIEADDAEIDKFIAEFNTRERSYEYKMQKEYR